MDKPCTKCGEIKSRTFEFYPRNDKMRDGLASWCRVCCKNLARERSQRPEVRAYYSAKGKARRQDPATREHDRRKNKDWWLRHHYDLSIEEYEEKFVVQRGVCAICGRAETASDGRINRARQLAVDHSHVTEAVRGLLCVRCNMGLSALEEKGWLARAQAYLACYA